MECFPVVSYRRQCPATWPTANEKLEFGGQCVLLVYMCGHQSADGDIIVHVAVKDK